MRQIIMNILTLMLILNIAEAKANFKLNAGTNKTIQLGNIVVLKGKIIKGNEKSIEYYQWTKKGKTLINTAGDEILYTNKVDAENDYKPTTVGTHLLHFQAITFDGHVYEDILQIIVKGKTNKIILNAGKNQTIQLGDTVKLKGKTIKGNEQSIEYFQWTKKGNILINDAGDKILYNNKIDAENDYTPTIAGEHLLHFQAIAFDGKKYDDTLLIIVQVKSSDLVINAGNNKSITLGDNITLEGLIKKGSKLNNVYSWIENNKIIKNMSGDEILYVNYDDRENSYKPTTIGTQTLTFKVETESGKVFTDTLRLTVKKKGGGGNPNDPLTREELKAMINAGKDLTKVNTSEITDMSRLFINSDFNQDISAWDVSSVTNMEAIFANTSKFNQPLNNWNVSNVKNMKYMFNEAKSFNQSLDTWDVSKVTNMSEMFHGAKVFNESIGKWNVSKVTNMSEMFLSCYHFNKPINNWNVSNVKNMGNMFALALKFNQPLDKWDVSQVTNMYEMFYQAIEFNQNLNNWNVSNVSKMVLMFAYTKKFNQPLNNWDVSHVKTMNNMFASTHEFNQPLNNWNVSSVINMSDMFAYTKRFNQPLNNWDVSNVINMSHMFSRAERFNQPLNMWNVLNVTNHLGIFRQPNLMEEKNKPKF